MRVAAVFLVALCACSSENEHPPEYTPTLPTPTTCGKLQESGQPSGTELRVDGETAHCAAEGLECPLWDLDVCEADGMAVAYCLDGTWRLVCESPDAAAP